MFAGKARDGQGGGDARARSTQSRAEADCVLGMKWMTGASSKTVILIGVNYESSGLLRNPAEDGLGNPRAGGHWPGRRATPCRSGSPARGRQASSPAPCVCRGAVFITPAPSHA